MRPKRRPLRPQQPVFSVFRRGGLHFGHDTTANRDLTATRRGLALLETPTRRRHAVSQLLMPQRPIAAHLETVAQWANPNPAGMEDTARPASMAAVPVGGGAHAVGPGRASHSDTSAAGVEGAGGSGGPGRASRSTTPSCRLACGDLAGGRTRRHLEHQRHHKQDHQPGSPPPTGTTSSPA